ncbi:MAG TPA: MBL fold metallo-hydrolase [Gemmatimonadaceae bacterium]|nr:MBL fold metallo-hydrolase [Gemmatimonadaceae bacterium]
MSLTLRFWGTRGSIPTPGPATVRYGGNTPCVEVRTAAGALVILDAGTGIRPLGNCLVEQARGARITGDIFLSHAHWDHIQGLPFFTPIFRPGNHFRIWSAASEAEHVARAVREQMSPTVFPVTFDELGATVEFRALAGGHADADYSLDVYSVRHPGGALAYRMRTGNSRRTGLVYISDNELGDATGYDSPIDWRARLVSFTRGASILVHDAMYTREEYEQHRGWGHSHYHDVVQLALDAGVSRVVLYHHNPERSDAEIDDRVAECRALVAQRGAALEVIAAAEGLTLTT